MTQQRDAERTAGQRADGPPPDHRRAGGSLSVAATARAIALVVDLRFSIARLRLQLRDVDVDRG